MLFVPRCTGSSLCIVFTSFVIEGKYIVFIFCNFIVSRRCRFVYKIASLKYKSA